MAATPDWRALIARHATTTTGADLSPDVLEELAVHLEDVYAGALAEGRPEADAIARAREVLEGSPLGGVRRSVPPPRPGPQTEPRAGARLAAHLPGALRQSLRQFRQHPGFAGIVVLVLGLCTGAAATVFTVVDAVVLQPLPYARPDRLVTLWAANAEKGLSHEPVSPVDFMDYRALPVFEDAAGWWRPAVNLVDPGREPVRVATIETSANLFELLGVRPQIGPGFPPHDELFVRNEPMAVISDRLWRARYGADPSIVGRQLDLGGRAFTIAGVMPPRFHFPDDVDVWQRLGWDFREHHRNARFLETVARLAPGTTADEALAATGTLAARLQREFASTNSGWGMGLVPLLHEELGYYRPALLVLFGAVGLLLVIGCLNVASLLVVRALSREREVAVRVALGASPPQLAVQFVAESLVLSLAGAALGIVTAAAALPLVVALTPVPIPRLDEAGVDLRALGLGVGVVTATTLFFGLLPTLLLLGSRISTGLRTAERGSSRGAQRLYSGLVIGEVALACALLVSSALLVRTVSRMMATPTGVEAEGVLTARVQLDGRDIPDWRVVAETHARLLDRIREQPGVMAAGAANVLPLEPSWRMPFFVDREAAPADLDEGPQAQYHAVSDGYFDAMGAVLVAGRDLRATDTAQAPRVVVVNETFARRFFGGGPAVGRSILTGMDGVGPLGRNIVRSPVQGEPVPFEIVGVVRDIRNVPLGQSVEPAMYFTSRQFPFRELILSVRAVDRQAAALAIGAALAEVAPRVPATAARTWDEIRAARSAEPRLLMTVLVFFGVLAAALAALGVYGLFSWTVALRRRELAIRLTLGAVPARVGGMVLRRALALVAAGLAAGVLLVQLAEGALARVLFDVAPGDPAATIAASLALLVAAVGACVPPVLRAMRTDPQEGLRAE